MKYLNLKRRFLEDCLPDTVWALGIVTRGNPGLCNFCHATYYFNIFFDNLWRSTIINYMNDRSNSNVLLRSLSCSWLTLQEEILQDHWCVQVMPFRDTFDNTESLLYQYYKCLKLSCQANEVCKIKWKCTLDGCLVAVLTLLVTVHEEILRDHRCVHFVPPCVTFATVENTGKFENGGTGKQKKCHHYKTRSLCNATTIRGSRDAKQKCRDLEFKDWELEEAMSKVRRLALILNLGTIWTCWRLVVQDHMRGLVIIWILWGKADFWFEETLDAIRM